MAKASLQIWIRFMEIKYKFIPSSIKFCYMDIELEIKKQIRDIHDYPKPGIVFKDLTPILKSTELCKKIISEFCARVTPLEPDAICCLDARGFWFGMCIAVELGIPMIPVRKKGKLPYSTFSQSYELEYGIAEVEIHTDAVHKGTRVLIHDDLLATGGTASAAAELVKKSGGALAGFAFLVELEFLKGHSKISPYSDHIVSLCKY
jgi:adenine phosphoribosyltransferase